MVPIEPAGIGMPWFETDATTRCSSPLASKRIGCDGSPTGTETTASGSDGTDSSENRDPISGTPGAHPVGTGVGAAAGGIAAGAAAGSVAGPVGTVVGAAVGAVAGGLAGKGVAEKVDSTVSTIKKPRNSVALERRPNSRRFLMLRPT